VKVLQSSTQSLVKGGEKKKKTYYPQRRQQQRQAPLNALEASATQEQNSLHSMIH
jgi:hypothetical protein